MSKKLLLTLLTVLFIVSVPSSFLRAADDNSQEVALRGANEVPSATTTTTGKFFIEFESTSTARFRLTVENGRQITQAHLHCAIKGENGPVVATLFGLIPGGFDVDGELAAFVLTDANIASSTTPCTPRLRDITDLREAVRDGKIYVNVHSVSHPEGLIRAQLLGETKVPNGTATTSTSTPTGTDQNGTTTLGSALSRLSDVLSRLVESLSQFFNR